MKKKHVNRNKAADGIDVEFAGELAAPNDVEANPRANAG
ncbi:YfhD family protein, partial [Bacillus cereus]|nr:YfhD family protein [Bacillus cereus]